PILGNRFPDNFLGTPKAIDGRRVDQIDAALDRGVNGANGFTIITAAPHPSPHRPCAQGDSRCFDFCSADLCVFHDDSLSWVLLVDRFYRAAIRNLRSCCFDERVSCRDSLDTLGKASAQNGASGARPPSSNSGCQERTLLPAVLDAAARAGPSPLGT